MWTDIRYACRILRVNRAFAVTVLLTLALGIGSTVIVFSLVNEVLLRPLPYPDPKRIVSVAVVGRAPKTQLPSDGSSRRRITSAFSEFR
jgi:hypothetical protein